MGGGDGAGFGWVAYRTPLPSNGERPQFPPGATNAAFRFGVSHGTKLRACDDLRNNVVNWRTAVLTPITLPTRGHLAQLANLIFPSATNWHFLEGAPRLVI